MSDCLDRREFLRSIATLAAGASLAVGTRCGVSLAAESACKTPNCAKLNWQLCASLYTYRRFPFYEALAMIDAAGFDQSPWFYCGVSGSCCSWPRRLWRLLHSLLAVASSLMR